MQEHPVRQVQSTKFGNAIDLPHELESAHETRQQFLRRPERINHRPNPIAVKTNVDMIGFACTANFIRCALGKGYIAPVLQQRIPIGDDIETFSNHAIFGMSICVVLCFCIFGIFRFCIFEFGKKTKMQNSKNPKKEKNDQHRHSEDGVVRKSVVAD